MTMSFTAKTGSLCLLISSLCNFNVAQSATPRPTPPIVAEEECCISFFPEIVRLRISVWDPGAKTFVNNLDPKDFEIREGRELSEIEIFIRPDENAAAEDLKNQYVLGLALRDLEQNKWHDLKVRVRASKGTRRLIVKATPSGYYY